MEEGGSIWSAHASDSMVGYPSVGRGSTYSRMQNPEYRHAAMGLRLCAVAQRVSCRVM